MKVTLTLVMSLLSLMIAWTQAKGQEFHEDGSMILSEVSSNKKYGYKPTPKTAIKVGKVEHEQAYLKALRGPNGEQVQFRRISSCCQFKSKSALFGSGFLDKYEVYYQGLPDPIILYLNGYDFESPKAPLGFTFVTSEKVEQPIIYPIDSITQVSFCNEEKQYAVENSFLLKEKIGEKEAPDTNPTFEGNIEELKRYFTNNPLTDKKANNIVFRVTIAFVVDCNGNAGNYMVITKGKGPLESLANQVLEIVSKMPKTWKPATKNGKNVDCHQVLSFMVVDGKLDKVSYQ